MHLHKTENLSVSVCTIQDGKSHCKRLHLYKMENLTVSVYTCTRRKSRRTGMAYTRQKTLLYESAPAQEGKPRCTSLHLQKTEKSRFTGIHMYKTERLAVIVCTCTRRKTYNVVLTTVQQTVAILEHKKRLCNGVISSASFVF
jgi:hypothetical protein